MMRFTPSLLVIAGVLLFAQPAVAQPPLLERVLALYGQRWATTNAMEQKGVTFSARRNAEGPVTRLWQFPEKMRVDLRYPDNTGEERVIDGVQAWQHGKPANPVLQRAIRLQAVRLALPRLLMEYRDRVETGGTIQGPQGEVWQSLQMALDKDTDVTLAVDKQGYIRRSEGTMRMGESSVTFATLYDDYRTVKGRLVAFRETHFAMGHRIGHTQLQTVDFPPSIVAARFRP